MKRYEEEGGFDIKYDKLTRAPHDGGEYVRITADSKVEGSASAYFFIYHDHDQEDRMYVCINHTICYLDDMEEAYFPVCECCGSKAVEMREYNSWNTETGGWEIHDFDYYCLHCGSDDGIDFGEDNG
jgi:hypothetical protein